MNDPAADQMEACAEMMKPREQHARIAKFEGTWRARVKLWMGPGDPQESTGVMTNTMILGGKFLEQVYEDDAGMFSGRGFWGYNTIDKRYEGVWIDSMSNFFQIDHGQVEGDVWTMRGEMTDPTGGGVCKKRSVITQISPDEHTMEMHFEMGGQESKGMEIHYTRAE